MTHPFQPDPDVKDYCKCGFHKSNPEHDHFPVIRRYEHERCEDLIEEWKARALVAERELDKAQEEIDRMRHELITAHQWLEARKNEIDGLRRDLAKAEAS